MTIRQLAIELGVASVYLEDEIALLERYRLLTAQVIFHHFQGDMEPGRSLRTGKPLEIIGHGAFPVFSGKQCQFPAERTALLERYRLLTSLPGGKYRASLLILTEEYMEEFFRTAEKSVMSDVKEILGDAG